MIERVREREKDWEERIERDGETEKRREGDRERGGEREKDWEGETEREGESEEDWEERIDWEGERGRGREENEFKFVRLPNYIPDMFVQLTSPLNKCSVSLELCFFHLSPQVQVHVICLLWRKHQQKLTTKIQNSFVRTNSYFFWWSMIDMNLNFKTGITLLVHSALIDRNHLTHYLPGLEYKHQICRPLSTGNLSSLWIWTNLF